MSSSMKDKGVTTKRIKPENKKIPDGYKLVPPDGNYGWIVVFACCLAGACSAAPLSVFSVLLYDLISLHDTNAATLSWVPSIILTTSQFSGPVNTVIVNTIGIRKAAVLGGFLISLGMTTSYLVTRIELLCVTYGFIVGFGFGLHQMCIPLIQTQYFRKYYGLVTGVFCGSYAAGRFINISVAQFSLEEYGCRGVFLIVGACTLNMCVAACLYQPVQRHLVLVPIDPDSKKLLDSNEEKVEDKTSPVIDDDAVAEHEDVLTKEKNFKNNYKNEVPEPTLLSMPINEGTEKNRNSLLIYSNEFGSISSIAVTEKDMNNDIDQEADRGFCRPSFFLSWCCKNICNKIDFSLLREPCFYVICGNGVLMLSTTVYGNFFLFPIGLEKGCSTSQLASIITFKVIADIASRVIGPSLITYFNLPVRKSYICLAFLNGIIFAAMIFADSFDKIIAWALASGLAFGPISGFSRVLIVKTMGTKRLQSVIGLSNFVQGVLLLPIAPILGWIRDTTGSFANIYLVLSFMQFTLMTLWIIKPYLPQKPPQNE